MTLGGGGGGGGEAGMEGREGWGRWDGGEERGEVGWRGGER